MNSGLFGNSRTDLCFDALAFSEDCTLGNQVLQPVGTVKTGNRHAKNLRFIPVFTYGHTSIILPDVCRSFVPVFLLSWQFDLYKCQAGHQQQ